MFDYYCDKWRVIYCADCRELSLLGISAVVTDPPYSEEDASHYGRCLVNRNRVVSECFKVLRDGGFLVWLDQVLPMYRESEFTLVGTIGVVRSTNHRFRIVSIFQKGEC